jgi:hypothetical protein
MAPRIEGCLSTAGVWRAPPVLFVGFGWTLTLVEGLQRLKDLSHMDDRAAV